MKRKYPTNLFLIPGLVVLLGTIIWIIANNIKQGRENNDNHPYVGVLIIALTVGIIITILVLKLVKSPSEKVQGATTSKAAYSKIKHFFDSIWILAKEFGRGAWYLLGTLLAIAVIIFIFNGKGVVRWWKDKKTNVTVYNVVHPTQEQTTPTAIYNDVATVIREELRSGKSYTGKNFKQFTGNEKLYLHFNTDSDYVVRVTFKSIDKPNVNWVIKHTIINGSDNVSIEKQWPENRPAGYYTVDLDKKASFSTTSYYIN